VNRSGLLNEHWTFEKKRMIGFKGSRKSKNSEGRTKKDREGTSEGCSSKQIFDTCVEDYEKRAYV